MRTGEQRPPAVDVMACYRCSSPRRASRGPVRFGTGGADKTYYVLGNRRGSGPHSILPEANTLPSVILEPPLGAGGITGAPGQRRSPLSALWPSGGLGGEIKYLVAAGRERAARSLFSTMSSSAVNSQVSSGGGRWGGIGREYGMNNSGVSHSSSVAGKGGGER